MRKTKEPFSTAPYEVQLRYELCLPDAEHLRAAIRTHTLHRGPSVLQSNLLGILDLNLLPALHAIRCGHNNNPPLY